MLLTLMSLVMVSMCCCQEMPNRPCTRNSNSGITTMPKSSSNAHFAVLR